MADTERLWAVHSGRPQKEFWEVENTFKESIITHKI